MKSVGTKNIAIVRITPVFGQDPFVSSACPFDNF